MHSKPINDEDTHLKVLQLVEANPKLSQRELAETLGISLGKANYCVRALIAKGLLKMQNFQNSEKKLAYAYLLTPMGISEKSAITARFLKRKLDEYEQLRLEIELLQSETSQSESQIK